jgi:hypothetical protein
VRSCPQNTWRNRHGSARCASTRTQSILSQQGSAWAGQRLEAWPVLMSGARVSRHEIAPATGRCCLKISIRRSIMPRNIALRAEREGAGPRRIRQPQARRENEQVHTCAPCRRVISRCVYGIMRQSPRTAQVLNIPSPRKPEQKGFLRSPGARRAIIENNRFLQCVQYFACNNHQIIIYVL